MLCGAAPDRGRAVWPTAAPVETVSAKEPGWRARSPRYERGCRQEQDPTEAWSRSFQLSHNQPTNERTNFQIQPANLFLPQPTTNSPTLSLYSEDGVVIYRSPRSGRGLGEADVIVRPDWTGPSWGPPFLGGISARPGKPAHSTHVWTRQEGIGTFGEAEELEQRMRRFCLEKRASGDSRWTMVRCGQRTEGCKCYGTVDRDGGDIKIY